VWQRGFGEERHFLFENLVPISVLVNKSTFLEVGMFDLQFVGGLEDWNLWLTFAEHGFWGHTCTSKQFWYRRRPNHSDRWKSWTETGVSKFKKSVASRFRRLGSGFFPSQHCPRWEVMSKVAAPLTEKLLPLPKMYPRLLMLVPWLEVGGADRFNLDILENFRKHQFEVTIVCTVRSKHPWQFKFEEFTPDIFYLPQFLPFSSYFKFISHLISTRNPDFIMNSNSGVGFSIISAIKKLFPHIVIFDYSHMEEKWMDGGWSKFSASLSSIFDVTFAASTHLKEWMVNHGSDDNKVVVLHVGVNTDYFSPILVLPDSRAKFRAKYQIATRSTVILFAARIVEQKQPFVFARIVLSLSSKFSAGQVHFIVSGDGPLLRSLQLWMLRKKLLPLVTFVGVSTPEQLRILYAASDLLLLPSKNEGIPCVVYEAMSMGLPVISSDVGGVAEIITNFENGILIPIMKSRKLEDLFSEDIQVARFSAVLTDVVSNFEVISKLGSNARMLMTSKFDFSSKIFSRLMQQLLIKKRQSGLRKEMSTQTLSFVDFAQLSMSMSLIALDSEIDPEYCLDFKSRSSS
jgi:glycosyltransferase involved in cell wall biosynthesis